VVVPGQAAIAANSQCEAWADVSDPTVDHTTADHLAAAPHMRFQAGDPIVPGASFTVYVSTEDGIPGVAIGAGGATVSNGTVALSNANGVSFGFGAGPNTSVLSASVAAQSVDPPGDVAVFLVRQVYIDAASHVMPPCSWPDRAWRGFARWSCGNRRNGA
jgi:hypothetical protein